MLLFIYLSQILTIIALKTSDILIVKDRYPTLATLGEKVPGPHRTKHLGLATKNCINWSFYTLTV